MQKAVGISPSRARAYQHRVQTYASNDVACDSLTDLTTCTQNNHSWTEEQGMTPRPLTVTSALLADPRSPRPRRHVVKETPTLLRDLMHVAQCVASISEGGTSILGSSCVRFSVRCKQVQAYHTLSETSTSLDPLPLLTLESDVHQNHHTVNHNPQTTHAPNTFTLQHPLLFRWLLVSARLVMDAFLSFSLPSKLLLTALALPLDSVVP